MKRKYITLLLSVTLTASAITGCGTTTAEKGSTIYGEIHSIDDDTITINIGTKAENEDSSTTDTDESPVLDLTGETKEITVDDGTEIKRQDAEAMPDDEAPEKPEGENASSEPPEKPEGEDTSSEPPEKPEGENTDGETSQKLSDTISIEDLSEGDILEIAFDGDNNVEKITVLASANATGGKPTGQTMTAKDYTAVTHYTEDSDTASESFVSTGKDENAILISDEATVSLDNIDVSRESSDSTGGDNASFYGVGAAILGISGETTITNSTITTDSAGGAGIFAYGDAIIYASDTSISTKQDTSGGIHVAGGGTLYAINLNVTTEGNSSAAIRSDRGSGILRVDGGSYTSNGTGSPAIYSTADIAVNNASLAANNSEAICIEGRNAIRLFDSSLTGNMQDDDQNDCTWNVILYQSMSGDSEDGNSIFEMNGGTLTAKNGGMFYTTNTESTFVLSGVNITYSDDNPFFLRCTGNANQRGWGASGENGADCSFTAINQEMEGDIIWDSISSLDFYMTDGSTLTGAVINDETYAGDGGSGYCKLYIEKGSTWTVTGDSTLSELFCAGTIVDENGKTVTIKGSDGTVYANGTSAYTITVDSYSDAVDLTGISSLSSWSDYKF